MAVPKTGGDGRTCDTLIAAPHRWGLSPLRFRRQGVPIDLSNWISFRDEGLKRRYSDSRIPMNTLNEPYPDETLDLKGGRRDLMRKKDLFVNYRVAADQA